MEKSKKKSQRSLNVMVRNNVILKRRTTASNFRVIGKGRNCAGSHCGSVNMSETVASLELLRTAVNNSSYWTRRRKVSALLLAEHSQSF